MNVAIRITQAFLVLFALNGLYGLALQLFLSPLANGQKPIMWNTIGSIVTICVIGLIVFLLQRYYEIRNKTSASITPKKYLGIALTGASIVMLIGTATVILIMLLAWLNI